MPVTGLVAGGGTSSKPPRMSSRPVTSAAVDITGKASRSEKIMDNINRRDEAAILLRPEPEPKPLEAIILRAPSPWPSP